MTHSELVARAVRWLKGSQGCVLTITEPQGHGFHEWPDAIEWNYQGLSILVECKTSMSDYYSDRRKDRVDGGMGDFRWYMTPPGLLKPDLLRDGWGLLECHPKKTQRKVSAVSRWKNQFKQGEVALLVQGFRPDFGTLAKAQRDTIERRTHGR